MELNRNVNNASYDELVFDDVRKVVRVSVADVLLVRKDGASTVHQNTPVVLTMNDFVKFVLGTLFALFVIGLTNVLTFLFLATFAFVKTSENWLPALKRQVIYTSYDSLLTWLKEPKDSFHYSQLSKLSKSHPEEMKSVLAAVRSKAEGKGASSFKKTKSTLHEHALTLKEEFKAAREVRASDAYTKELDRLRGPSKPLVLVEGPKNAEDGRPATVAKAKTSLGKLTELNSNRRTAEATKVKLFKGKTSQEINHIFTRHLAPAFHDEGWTVTGVSLRGEAGLWTPDAQRQDYYPETLPQRMEVLLEEKEYHLAEEVVALSGLKIHCITFTKDHKRLMLSPLYGLPPTVGEDMVRALTNASTTASRK